MSWFFSDEAVIYSNVFCCSAAFSLATEATWTESRALLSFSFLKLISSAYYDKMFAQASRYASIVVRRVAAACTRLLSFCGSYASRSVKKVSVALLKLVSRVGMGLSCNWQLWIRSMMVIQLDSWTLEKAGLYSMMSTCAVFRCG